MFDDETRKSEMSRLTHGLLKLARSYRRMVDKRLAEHQISDARALPVLYLTRHGAPMRQRALAEEVGIEGPSLVRLLDQLCAMGLVERQPDPDDGRAKAIHPTDEGRALAEVVEVVLHDLRMQVMARVSDEDLAATLRTFDAMVEGLQQISAGDEG